MSNSKKDGLQESDNKSRSKRGVDYVDVDPSKRLDCIRQTGLWPFLVLLLQNEPDSKYNILINKTTDQEFDLLLSQLISMKKEILEQKKQERK